MALRFSFFLLAAALLGGIRERAVHDKTDASAVQKSAKLAATTRSCGAGRASPARRARRRRAPARSSTTRSRSPGARTIRRRGRRPARAARSAPLPEDDRQGRRELHRQEAPLSRPGALARRTPKRRRDARSTRSRCKCLVPVRAGRERRRSLPDVGPAAAMPPSRASAVAVDGASARRRARDVARDVGRPRRAESRRRCGRTSSSSSPTTSASTRSGPRTRSTA